MSRQRINIYHDVKILHRNRLGDLDGLAQVADTALDLDLLVQELLESGDIEDLVAGGLRGVDDEL